MRTSTLLLAIAVLAFVGSLTAEKEGVAEGKDENKLKARMEVDEHEQSFTVRFFIKNESEEDQKVMMGRGGAGMSVVPHFRLSDMTITPPTYLMPPRRSLKPDYRNIPAGKEILYATFTMGYPYRAEAKEEQISATIIFLDPNLTLQTTEQPLKIPASAIHFDE